MTILRSNPLHQAVLDTMTLAMRQDDGLSVIVAEPSKQTGQNGLPGLDAQERQFNKEFGPWRVMRLPYAADTVMGAALGAAAGGLRVIADLTALDDASGIVDEVIRHERMFCAGPDNALPIVIRAKLGGQTSSARHLAAIAAQSQLLAVAMPATPAEASGLMLEALRMRKPALILESDSPQAFEDDRIPGGPTPLPFGLGKQVRVGDDMTVIAFASHRAIAKTAADFVEQSDQIRCDVIDPRTIAPLDMRLITESVERTGRLVLLEDARHRCPICSDIASRVSEQTFSALIGPVARIGIDAQCPDPSVLAEGYRQAFARRN